MNGIPIDPREQQWQSEEDARTMKRYGELMGNPDRVRRAQSVIKTELDATKRALGVPVPPPAPGRANPATIMRLNPRNGKPTTY
jgi:hypothetical protein